MLIIDRITQLVGAAEVVPNEQRCVTNRLGYEIEILTENGEFKQVIIIPDDTTDFVYLKVSALNSLDDELKDIVESYLRYVIERYHARTVMQKVDMLLMVTSKLQKNDVAQVLNGLLLEKNSLPRNGIISNAKEFARFLDLHEYLDLPSEVYEEFLEVRGYSQSPNSYANLFLMDENHGPFTAEELSVLSAEVNNEKHSLKLRLLLELCICFGLRPIQISLLKRKDYVVDKVSSLRYLNVPRVKNLSHKRRSQFTARLLSDRTANLLEQYVEATQVDFPDVEQDELPIFLSPRPINLERASNFRGAKYWSMEARTSSDYYDSAEKKSYIHHKQSHRLTRTLSFAAANFPLSPRTGLKFNLHPYRFRYTVGTCAVMSGCTPEEVADLLDHSSTLCVKHYFRFTRDMWEILERATLNRIEQQHFTAAWLREDELKGNIYARAVYETRSFTAIGKCATESACFEEPAVACYSCKKFCPSKDADAHRKALNNLNQRKESVLLISTSNVVSVLDQSIAGCHAAIAYAEGKHVILINAREA